MRSRRWRRAVRSPAGSGTSGRPSHSPCRSSAAAASRRRKRRSSAELGEPLGRHAAEQAYGIAVRGGPALGVDGLEEVAGLGMPGPAQIARQVAERVKGFGEYGTDGESTDCLHELPPSRRTYTGRAYRAQQWLSAATCAIRRTHVPVRPSSPTTVAARVPPQLRRKVAGCAYCDRRTIVTGHARAAEPRRRPRVPSAAGNSPQPSRVRHGAIWPIPPRRAALWRFTPHERLPSGVRPAGPVRAPSDRTAAHSGRSTPSRGGELTSWH